MVHTDIFLDKHYLECGLPEFLSASIAKMTDSWKALDAGKECWHWDCDYCDLQTNINNAEVNHVISAEQADFLRRKYLRTEWR